jgi:hypothetical protein
MSILPAYLRDTLAPPAVLPRTVAAPNHSIAKRHERRQRFVRFVDDGYEKTMTIGCGAVTTLARCAKPHESTGGTWNS